MRGVYTCRRFERLSTMEEMFLFIVVTWLTNALQRPVASWREDLCDSERRSVVSSHRRGVWREETMTILRSMPCQLSAMIYTGIAVSPLSTTIGAFHRCHGWMPTRMRRSLVPQTGGANCAEDSLQGMKTSAPELRWCVQRRASLGDLCGRKLATHQSKGALFCFLCAANVTFLTPIPPYHLPSRYPRQASGLNR